MRILCVGNGARADYLVSALTESNHSVLTTDVIDDAAWRVASEHIDIAIVLTRGDAANAALAMRARPLRTSLVIVDSPGDADARVRSLQAGADACFAAQYDYVELEARLHALQRDAVPAGCHDDMQAAASSYAPTFTASAQSPAVVTLSHATRSLLGRDQCELTLSRREYLLLERLLREPGKVTTHDELVDYVFGEADADVASLHLLVSRLRRRLTPPTWPVRIDTAPRVGYSAIVER